MRFDCVRVAALLGGALAAERLGNGSALNYINVGHQSGPASSLQSSGRSARSHRRLEHLNRITLAALAALAALARPFDRLCYVSTRNPQVTKPNSASSGSSSRFYYNGALRATSLRSATCVRTLESHHQFDKRTMSEMAKDRPIML